MPLPVAVKHVFDRLVLNPSLVLNLKIVPLNRSERSQRLPRNLLMRPLKEREASPTLCFPYKGQDLGQTKPRTILKLQNGVLKFVKYVSAAAEGSRWDICGEFEIGMVQEDSSEES